MKQASKPPSSFEAALKELEGIVQSMEDGSAPLEESLKSYERGIVLLDYCQETLARAEQKIRLLDNGQLRDLAVPDAEAGSDA
ncbi:MAG: exodeoxyribonuclease VII small subunit [Rhodocyclaceae bacterium]|jgi:exodeoxyribonuclease VII small subunit|nr:exodeoxyribonuclease VII small subunit [Rhodocyclaceae bacterium]